MVPAFDEVNYVEKLYRLYSASNYELRAMIMLEVTDDWLITERIAEKISKQTRAKNILSIPKRNYSKIAYHCHRLYSIGGIIKTKVRRENSWALAEDGKKYYRPAAALTLIYSAEKLFQQSCLEKAIGRVSISPPKTHMILKILKEKVKCRISDVSKGIGVSCWGVSKHLARMKSVGLINYVSVGPRERDWSRYEVKLGQQFNKLSNYKRYAKGAKTVYRFLRKRPHMDFSCNEIASATSLRSNLVSGILSWMEDRGFVERTTLFKGNYARSLISLTDLGRELWGMVGAPFDEVALGRWNHAESEFRTTISKLESNATFKIKTYTRAYNNYHQTFQ